jgi:hypothetical protein
MLLCLCQGKVGNFMQPSLPNIMMRPLSKLPILNKGLSRITIQHNLRNLCRHYIIIAP